MPRSLKGVIIKGNPLYINTGLARRYYYEIEKFLKANGVTHVTYDAGEDHTMPRMDADIYIGHSRGCGRYKYMPEDKKKVFLKFGVPGGIIDPVDRKWCEEVYVKGTVQQPPKEHFIFIDAQKEAILKLLRKIKGIDQKKSIVTKW